MNKISDFTKLSHRDNNFNLLRYIAALTVLIVHSYTLALGAGAKEPSIGNIALGSIAVDVFFITSGFLITSSMINRGDLVSFAWNRFLRIFPALVVSVFFCAFIIGPFFTNIPVFDYFVKEQTWQFIFKNIFLVFGCEYWLPGVFLNLPKSETVNGSLWTLPWELRMYAVLLILGCLFLNGKVKKERELFICVYFIAAFSMIIHIINFYFPFIDNSTLKSLFKLLSMFFIGASLYGLQGKVLLSWRVVFVLLILMFFCASSSKFFFFIYTLFIGYLTLFFAYVPSRSIKKFNEVGDYSYGIYIYAYPIQQSIAALTPGISILEMMISSFVVTSILAYASWNLIEKKAMEYKSNYLVFRKMFFKFKIKY